MTKFFVRRSSTTGVSRIQRDSYGPNWGSHQRAVARRDGQICMHPGCTNNVNTSRMETHHISRLSAGGLTTKRNLILFCEKHHEMRHPHMTNRKPKL